MNPADVCSLRLDFDTLDLAAPSVASAAGDDGGVCEVDRLELSSSDGTAYPVLCGANSGYHGLIQHLCSSI